MGVCLHICCGKTDRGVPIRPDGLPAVAFRVPLLKGPRICRDGEKAAFAGLKRHLGKAAHLPRGASTRDGGRTKEKLNNGRP